MPSLLTFIKQKLCDHKWTWIERRQAEVCVKCGVVKPRG